MCGISACRTMPQLRSRRRRRSELHSTPATRQSGQGHCRFLQLQRPPLSDGGAIPVRTGRSFPLLAVGGWVGGQFRTWHLQRNNLRNKRYCDMYRMTALARTSSNYKRQERMLHKDYDWKGSVEKKSLVVSLKGLGAKKNWLAVNRQS
jgi:hypothetical protein